MKLGRMSEVKIPVEVVLGRTQLSVAELSNLENGSILELESIAGEPVELRVGGEVIGRGEVVVIDEAFGLRVTELLSESAAQGSRS